MYVYLSYLCSLCSWCVSGLFLALVVCVPLVCVFLFSCIGFLVSCVSLLVLCFLLWWVSLLGVLVPVCAVCLRWVYLLYCFRVLVFVSVVGVRMCPSLAVSLCVLLFTYVLLFVCFLCVCFLSVCVPYVCVSYVSCVSLLLVFLCLVGFL